MVWPRRRNRPANGFVHTMSGNAPTSMVFVNHWASRLGGAELSLQDLVARASQQARCHLVTTESGPLVENVQSHGVDCHIIPCPASVDRFRRDRLLPALFSCWYAVPGYVVFSFRLARLLRHLSPDIVHANVPKSHVGVFLAVLWGYRGATCFHLREIFHGNTAVRLLYAMFFPRTGASVIAISEAVRRRLPRRLRRRATVIHNGIPLPHVHRHDRKDRGVRFIYLGRVVPWKRCHLLLMFFARVRLLLPRADISLSIVGDTLYWPDSYRRQLHRSIHDLGIGQCCCLKGHTTRVYETLSSHDVFCSVADCEPFGRAAVEAQACGLPVVAVNSGGMNEVIANGTTGVLIEEGNEEAFVAAMAGFVEDTDRIAAMGEEARKRVQALFDAEVQVPAIVDFLRAATID